MTQGNQTHAHEIFIVYQIFLVSIVIKGKWPKEITKNSQRSRKDFKERKRNNNNRLA